MRKDLDACRVRVALCFPDIYEIGMSHTGLAILCEAVNRVDGWRPSECLRLGRMRRR
jgi:hypothetical protein